MRLTSRTAALFAASSFALAAISICPPARAQGASVESATAEQKATAQRAFEEGMKAQKAKKHDVALEKFKESYGAVASPNSHLMIARTLAELDRPLEAYEEYEKTIREAEQAAKSDPKYEGAAQSARTEQAEVRGKLAIIRLNVKNAAPGDRVTVGGKEIPENARGEGIAVLPGTIRIELTQSNGKETVQEVEATAGGDHVVDLEPGAGGGATEAKAESSASLDTSAGSPSMRTWAYVAGAVGVAGVATFAVFGAMSNSKHSKLEDECTNGLCPSDLEEDRDAGKRYQTIANIGLAVGIVGIGAGTALFLMSSGSSEKAAAAPRPKKGPRVDSVGLGYRSVVVTGTF